MRPYRVLAASAGLLCLVACRQPESAAPAAPGRTEPPRRAGSRAAAPAPAALDLQGMLAPVPEYEGEGRNLFAFGPARPAEAPSAVRREPAGSETPPPRAPARPAVRAQPVPPAIRGGGSSRIDVEYAGYVQKTDAAGNKSKYAVFFDGKEILTGAEGETVSNRFTVVEIGLESVTVTALGSDATERIPLKAN